MHDQESRTLLFDESKTKSLDCGKCSMSVTSHAVGIGTCTQGMTNPSYLSSEMHLQKKKSLTKRNFRAGSRISEQKILRKGEESRARASSRDKMKGADSLHRSGRLENVFSGRLLFKKETIVVFYTRMPRDAVRLWKEVGDARRSRLGRPSHHLHEHSFFHPNSRDVV